MNLLTICSTRQRANRCREMLASFFETRSDGTEIFLYVDETDPQVAEYRQLFAEYPVRCEIGKHRFMCHVLNYASTELFPGLPYYSDVNDDHIYRTKAWDAKLIEAIEKRGNGVGMAYGFTRNLPSAVVISGNYIRARGYFYFPEFQHHSCDLEMQNLGKSTDTLYHVPEVIIEHVHRDYGLAQSDATYDWVYSQEQAGLGRDAYDHWQRNQREIDIKKIMDLKHAASTARS